jgi:hypothetical protein
MQILRQDAQNLFRGLVITCLVVTTSLAHPGSGIVVDRQGQVYFVDTGQGVWKLDTQGRLMPNEGPAFHWMTIDTDGHFVKTPLLSSPSAEIRQVGINPTLILSSDFPLAIGRDGALYYPELGRDERLQVVRLVSSGTRTVLAKLPADTESGPLRWLNGMAAGPDGSIYYTENQALRKINQQGTLSTIASNISVPNCVRIPGYDDRLGVHLRGLDVASDGTVYVAATGCGALLRITARGEITAMLRTTSAWSPTGVAVAGNNVYVLEYLHTASDDRREWVPRVRKVSPDGKVAIVAAVERR